MVGPDPAVALSRHPEASGQEAVDPIAAAVAAVDALDAGSPADVGVAVLDRATGREVQGANGSAPFYAASITKLYTAVAILDRADRGELELDGSDLENIDRALRGSDDQAMNALWSGAGGPATVTETIGAVGLLDSAPPDDPSQWGETIVSARDVVTVYEYVLTVMSPAARDLVMDALGGAARTADDGFDQSFGLLADPRPGDVAAKQGWMWYGSRLYLHTTGTVGPGARYVVAVLARNPASSGAAAARELATAAAAAVRASAG